MGFGDVGVEDDGLTDQIHGHVIPPALIGDDAQQMQRFDMPRLPGEVCRQILLGLLEIARLGDAECASSKPVESLVGAWRRVSGTDIAIARICLGVRP